MWTISVLLLSLSLSSSALYTFNSHDFQQSAASAAQLRFALENKYDDTGPGAKEPEYAYNTYRTLEEALVGYLDDPDTKLPEAERSRAVQSLVGYQNYQNEEFERHYPKTVEEYTGYQPEQQTERPRQKLQLPIVLSKLPPKKYFQGQKLREVEAYRLRKVSPIRGNPLSLAHYTRDPEESTQDQYDPHPKYSFAYGVHNADTGDLKSAKEVRDGGSVRGYYSFMDADGKLRTVHYTADDKIGFRAIVDRS